ncbi:MAG: hypothetical protein ACRC6M_04390 [Microcystaceae cyanobacterium]
MAAKKGWFYAPDKPQKSKVTDAQKALITQQMTELIEQEFKPRCIKEPPTDNDFNYLVDIFGKWYRCWFYICGTYNCPGPGAIAPSFEVKFTRLEYVAPDQFNLAYFRHTGQWWEIAVNLTLEQALAEIKTNPILQPQ